ncbi:hypothetical protein FHS27_004861 [Rhodopirellula rubra]|uniref:DUF3311 domain-containing protein n=1 Tax=Aporhodopirellula rubra TaxID=980271 RepID=A0A7W5E2P0_9BACT|nr:DUF3311 domain-containing protein [Aporhodopirellula rubra]MBB3209025.1 hypothetical protein [Aporhodopirellula rubra]
MPDSPRSADASVASSSRTTTPGGSSRSGLWIIAALVVVLLVLHQDNWFWTDGRLVFGFIPIGLFWHACISIGASLTWFLTTKIAWPVESEFQAGTSPEHGSGDSVAANVGEGQK